MNMGVKPVIFLIFYNHFQPLSVRMKNRAYFERRENINHAIKKKKQSSYVPHTPNLNKVRADKGCRRKGHNVTATRTVPKYGTLT